MPNVNLQRYNSFINEYAYPNLVDGTYYHEPLKKTSPYQAGAYLRIERKSFSTSKFFCKGTENVYYPGNILAVDDNFFTANPTVIPFRESERKPLSFSTSNGAYVRYEPGRNPLDNVIPTERMVNRAINSFAYDFVNQHAVNSIGSTIKVDVYDYDSSEGIDLGGSIKDVDLGLKFGTTNKRARIFVFKQILFSVSVDNTYKSGDDLFTDNLNFDELRYYSQGHAPAMIQTVDYGRIVIISVTSSDYSAFSASISGASLNLGSNSSNCHVSIHIIGGNVGNVSSQWDYEGKWNAENILAQMQSSELDSSDITQAQPIAFTATYLRNMNKYVTKDVLPYAQVYVDRIRMRIVDNNNGVSFDGIFRCLDYAPDRSGRCVYTKIKKKGKLGFTTFISPHATCLEFKVDAYGGEWCDKNVFCPCVPLEQLRPDNEGYWTFRMYIQGNTLKSISFSFSPMIYGCYMSTENDTYISKNGILDEGYHSHYNKRECLIKFYSWCEWHWRKKGYMHSITPRNYYTLRPFTSYERSLFWRSDSAADLDQ